MKQHLCVLFAALALAVFSSAAEASISVSEITPTGSEQMQCTESVPLEVACSQIFLINAQGGCLGDPGDSKLALSSCTPADGSNGVWQEIGENGTACGMTGTLPASAVNFKCTFVPTPGPDTFKVDCVAFNAQDQCEDYCELTLRTVDGNSWTVVSCDNLNISTAPSCGQLKTEVTTATPEPAALTVWSLLGGIGIGLGWKRRRRAA